VWEKTDSRAQPQIRKRNADRNGEQQQSSSQKKAEKKGEGSWGIARQRLPGNLTALGYDEKSGKMVVLKGKKKREGTAPWAGESNCKKYFWGRMARSISQQKIGGRMYFGN